jgi:bisphosphoglycerate-dependent phosphoglycerate mutase
MNKETLSNKEAAKFDVKISPANMKKLSEIYKELGIDFTFPIEIEDANGNETYFEDEGGYWYHREYDKDGNETYYENSDGYWYRCEYNENGNETYREYSNRYYYRPPTVTIYSNSSQHKGTQSNHAPKAL